ncbi:MAG: carbohydrate ABC transporter substrate-binding protein [Lachnospiraceae bacterium]|nr:carbohydrate ABC transporter substrate-binding protein [Lachnospiraceae bacterium]
MKLKRIASLAMSVVLTAAVLTGCGGASGDTQSASADTGSAAASSGGSGDGVTITMLNSKMEIQEQLEKIAKTYTEKTGVGLEVYYSSDTIAAHLSTRYASNEPYTLSMVDAKDVYSLAAEHAVDLSSESWVGNTTEAISIDGKVYGFPVCVEARGVIYNGDAIKKITGKDFDPSSVSTLDAFSSLIDELKAGGMESPVGIMKEDWSLAAHYLAEVYEQQSDPDAFIKGLHEGSTHMGDDAVFNSMMDTFDVLKTNNYAASSAISAEREVTEQKLAEGEIAFMFGGNWDWSVINQYDYTDGLGMMPVPQNAGTDANTKLVGGGSKYIFIDSSSNTSEAQVQAAKDFLNWLVNDSEGQSFLVNDCALVPAFSNITLEVADPLGKSVKAYADKGALIGNYNYLPDDHYAKLGAAFQEYLADQTNRSEFADKIDSYWQATTPTEH